MTLTVTVHRGTQQIGGSCIELAIAGGERLILDAGRPLDAPRDAEGLLPATLNQSAPATVVFSHGHMDHWGLIGELPGAWPVWAGEKTAEMMRVNAQLARKPLTRPIATWHSRAKPFAIGNFTITPFLTDHSAMDAYMLLIEAVGRRVFYTGDFRAHGRKAKLVEALIAAPPRDIDVLLMEGTNLGSDKTYETESELEEKFVALARSTRRHVFVNWSAQNIDRTVTLLRAARRTRRKLALDLYGVDVLERLAGGTRVPVPGPNFPELKVVITKAGRRLYLQQGRKDFVDRMATSPFATSRLALKDERAIIMHRDTLSDEFAEKGLGFTPDDAYVFSNWHGYLDRSNPGTGWARAEAAGASTHKLHTSGHASPADLTRFAAAIAPKALVPVHGVAWDNPAIPLPPIQRITDGEAWLVP